MANDSINKELKRAVCKGSKEEVNSLLDAGANVNLIVHRSGNSLLHLTSTVEITRQLLLHGAEVNARNKYYDTVLHSAIKLGKEVELVKELLKQGADVHARDCKGNTPLQHAMQKRYIKHEVIEELLKYGDDISLRKRELRKRRFIDNHSSSLYDAVRVLPRAKLLIKYTLIHNFNEDYGKIIDLDPYKKVSNYSQLSSYLDACVCEILQMKTDKTRDSLSLYELVTSSFNKHIIYSNQLSLRVATTDFSVRYPIYNDIILDKIKPFLERADLLTKLDYQQVYTGLISLNQDIKEKKIVLDYYSAYNITKYLSNDDLLNFILAFDDSDEHVTQYLSTLNNVEDPETKFHETSISSNAKRARLE